MHNISAWNNPALVSNPPIWNWIPKYLPLPPRKLDTFTIMLARIPPFHARSPLNIANIWIRIWFVKPRSDDYILAANASEDSFRRWDSHEKVKRCKENVQTWRLATIIHYRGLLGFSSFHRAGSLCRLLGYVESHSKWNRKLRADLPFLNKRLLLFLLYMPIESSIRPILHIYDVLKALCQSS